jgi:hypothetical protein
MQATAPAFDRTTEDLGNIVELGHVNVTVPDQRLATIFYVMGLGLTRDPYLSTGIDNMWINAGRAQFHLPLRPAQVLRGTTGLVLADLEGLLRRLAQIAPLLEGTRFAFAQTAGAIEVTCPWGNRLRCHAPDMARFGPVTLGMPYVALDVPPGTLAGIVRFYRQILGAIAGMVPEGSARDSRAEAGQGAYAWVRAGDGARLLFHETSTTPAAFDGHHIQITLVDFSGPHRRLLERGLISEESDQHQYRFLDIVDPDSNLPLFRIEHEVRSMRHPMYARPLVNRDPAITNRSYAPEHQAARWATAPQHKS